MNRHQRRAFEKAVGGIINAAVAAETTAFQAAGADIHRVALEMRASGDFRSLEGVRKLGALVQAAVDRLVQGATRRAVPRLRALLGAGADGVLANLPDALFRAIPGAIQGTPFGRVFDALAEAESVAATFGRVDDDFDDLFEQLET